MGHSLLTPTTEFYSYLHIIEFWSWALLFSTHDKKKSMEECVPILTLRAGSGTYLLALAGITWLWQSPSGT